MSRPGCGGCAKVRSYLPAAIRVRLEEVERRMRTIQGPSVSMTITGHQPTGPRIEHPNPPPKKP